ncbi:MAG: hypothetical protein ACLP8S_26725 [Solirubrobacteraceae bacterium]|jgi:hypothetical protein
MLDTSKVGDLDEGTIVPVRLDSDHEHVVLDVPMLEAKMAAQKQKDADWRKHQKEVEVAAAERGDDGR